MLTTTTPICPIAATPPAAEAATEPGDGSAFAQALDRAEARQREGVDCEGPTVRSPPADERADATRSLRDAHGHGRRGIREAREAREPKAAELSAPAEPATAVADARPTSQTPVGAAIEDEAEEAAPPATETQPTPQELAAFVATLPLPRDPSAGAAAIDAADAAADATAREAVQPLPRDRVAATPRRGEALAAEALPSRSARAAERAGPVTAPGRAESLAVAAAASSHERTPTLTPTLPPTLTPAPTRAAAPPLPEAAAGPSRRGDEAPAGAAVALPVVAAARDLQAERAGGADLPAPALAALAAAQPPGAMHAAEASAAVQAEVRAPVGTDEFASALGARLSVLVRDGIEHAQLKLNPAELGPIEVRIELDGSRAQVDFSAAHAVTRQALQEAVPALASALRESGLTLAGGGVFEQPREQRGEARRDGARASARGDSATAERSAATLPPLPPLRGTRGRGVVDLYA